MLSLSLTSFSYGAPNDAQYKALSQRLSSQALVNYRDFLQTTEKLHRTCQSFCESPSADRLQEVKAKYQNSHTSWMAIEYIQFGPVADKLRNFRIYFWPDKRNILGRQLAPFLAKQDRAALSAKSFTTSTVALQGLSALERLLYSTKYTPRFLAKSQESKFQCAYLQAITNNLETIAREITEAWPSYSIKMANNPPKEQAAYWFQSLYDQARKIHDKKISIPLKSPNPVVGGRKLEAWRSQQTRTLLITNLKAIKSAYLSPDSFARLVQTTSPKEHKALLATLDQMVLSLRNIKGPVKEALQDQSQRQDLASLEANSALLVKWIKGPLSTIWDIPVGFNSADGD